MAGRNQRGPEEMGPMTGRGMGRCGDNGQGQQLRQGGGRGMGRGRGQGGGQGRGQGRGQGAGQGKGRGMGQGMGRGLGRGMGRGNQWQQNEFAGPTETNMPPMANALVQEVNELKSQLSDLTAKLNKLLEQA